MQKEQLKIISFILLISITFSTIGAISLTVFDSNLFKQTTVKKTTADGVNVYIDIFEPVTNSNTAQLFQAPRPAVIAVHGFGVSKEFFAQYGMEFARLGIVTICIELRSMGRSEGDFFNGKYNEWLQGVDFDREMTEQFPDISIFQNEVNLAFELLQSRTDIDMNSIALIGHSTGGGVVLQTALLNPEKIKVTVGIAALPVDGINATSHRNLMLVLGKFDEAFSFERTLELFRKSTGDPASLPNTRYGIFQDGSARMLIYTPFDDHFTETFNPGIMKSAVEWIVSGLKGQDFSVQGTVDIYANRILLIGVSAIGLILAVVMFGIIALDKMKEKQNWNDKKKLVQHIEPLEKIRLLSSVVSLIAINLLCFPITLGFFYIILAMGMTSASFILPFTFTFAISIIIYTKILSKRGIINGKQSIIELCIPSPIELLFSVGIGIMLLTILQTFFGRYFVSLLMPMHKIGAGIILWIGTIIFLIANEYWSRLIIQNRWEKEDFRQGKLLDFIKAKLLTAIISGLTFWICIVLGVLIFQQIVFSNFIWMIVFLILPLLVFINFINAIWYPYARRLPPVAMTFSITVVSALIAMSPFVNVWT